MTHMSVIMMLMDHVKYDLFCLHEDTTILEMREIFLRQMMRGKQKNKALTFILIQIIAFVFAVER